MYVKGRKYEHIKNSLCFVRMLNKYTNQILFVCKLVWDTKCDITGLKKFYMTLLNKLLEMDNMCRMDFERRSLQIHLKIVQYGFLPEFLTFQRCYNILCSSHWHKTPEKMVFYLAKYDRIWSFPSLVQQASPIHYIHHSHILKKKS